MQVNISGPAISYFEWEITSWAQTDPTIAGTLSGYDEELGYDIDYVRRRFMVRTRSPQLKYKSSGVLHTITSPFTETIRVTAVAANGYTTGAFFYVHALPRSEAGITAASALLQTAFPSNRRPGSYANYYQLTGSGDTTINMSSGVFDTYLALYNANHALIQTNDDISGADQNSRIRVTLQRGQTYIVEATSYAQSKTGEFALSVTGGSLSAATSPWTSDGGCAQVSGRYDVSQTIQYTGDVNETVPVQYVADIAATGCSFVGSATGDIGLEFGEVDSIDGAANTVTIRSFSLIITNPNLQIRISNFGGSGTITASGGVIRRMAVNEAFNMFMTMNGNSASVHVVTSAVFIRR